MKKKELARVALMFLERERSLASFQKDLSFAPLVFFHLHSYEVRVGEKFHIFKAIIMHNKSVATVLPIWISYTTPRILTILHEL